MPFWSNQKKKKKPVSSPLPLQSLTNAQSLEFDHPNPNKAKSTKLFSHHQPPPLSAVTTSDCHPRFSKVFSPPRVVKPEGAVNPGPILVVIGRRSSSPDLSSSSSSPRSRRCRRTFLLLDVANVYSALFSSPSQTCLFSSPSFQCLQNFPSSNNKFTYNCDNHTFNFLVDYGFIYCVVADESAGRQVPIAFLERVKDDFVSKYGASHKAGTNAAANSLNKEFGLKLKEHMQYCIDHPEEISKLAKVQNQVSEVKGVMIENIEKVHTDALQVAIYRHCPRWCVNWLMAI
ncbi:uncharacterized protein LOC130981457 [Arachis stenosperma]|uniref:uncharacterized protein LOC130981457 n=1 Tax=Arachis stenosperma TaxID=217475 RepID=UPI0025AD3943|nr:uncharacterized protein LOC130981457 [Arachis stenosperma]